MKKVLPPPKPIQRPLPKPLLRNPSPRVNALPTTPVTQTRPRGPIISNPPPITQAAKDNYLGQFYAQLQQYWNNLPTAFRLTTRSQSASQYPLVVFFRPTLCHLNLVTPSSMVPSFKLWPVYVVAACECRHLVAEVGLFRSRLYLIKQPLNSLLVYPFSPQKKIDTR